MSALPGGSPAPGTAPAPAPKRHAQDRPLLAVALVILGCGLLTLNDAIVKDLVAVLPLAQLVALRGVASVFFCILVVLVIGRPHQLLPRNPRAVATISLLLLVALFLFPLSLRYLPLADAIILAYLSPIIVTAIAPFALKESVGWKRWCAVLVGFLGAALVIDPTGGPIQAAVVLPLLVALLVAVRDVMTRRIVAQESTVALVVGASLGAVLLGGLAAPFDWVTPSWSQLGLIFLAGTLMSASQLLAVAAFRRGDAVLVSSFKYTGILWAGLLGYLFWGETLTLTAWLGTALIIASGVFIVGRTRKKQRERLERR